MNSIISITLNPALDLGGMVDQLVPNEKNYVHHETRYPGGNGINAARIIHRLSVLVMTTGFLGGGVGSKVEALLSEEKLRHDIVWISGPTRISVTVSNLKTHLQTRLSYSGPTINFHDWKTLTTHIKQYTKEGLAVIGGSLLPGVDAGLFKSLIEELSSYRISCIVDVPGKTLNAACGAGPLLIKVTRYPARFFSNI